ncbi:MAG: flagellar export protein FliJ [Oscillibacter sp.]|nr:flagellar export protein FliJ [Oscillibacter sp.]
MKKFKFALDTVLSYKQQVLDALQGEHAAILVKVHAQEDAVESLELRYADYNAEYRQRAEEGLPITDALMYQTGLRAIEMEIQQETAKLEALQEAEEKKRAEVVEAKKDTSSIEKLKEKKLEAYNKAVQKSDEQFIEEFVSAARANAASA